MEIVLIRHGKPTSANNPTVSAGEYTQWIRRYNLSGVAPNSRPNCIKERYQSFNAISSDLKRAIHSANIYLDKPPEYISQLYREMEIPKYKIPLKLKAWNWVYLSRLLWIFGCKGSFESYNQAKQRAEIAASQLIEAAKRHDKVILFGHGYMNLHIRRVLIRQGWMLNTKDNAYWGITSLETY